MKKHRTYPLTPSQLRGLEAELRRERARLERSMAADAAGEVAPAGESGRSVQPSGSSDGGVGLALRGRARHRHDAVLESLRRLEDGTYGTCAACQVPIPYGRLLALPEATHCVDCRLAA